MTYQTFYPEQRIEFYSLNNVSVLPNNTAYSVNSIRRTIIQLTYMAYSKQLDTAYLSSGNHLTKKGITTTEPNEYISITRKNFISNDGKGRMIKKSFVEIHGTFLIKIRDNTFKGEIKENAFKHINNFLKIVRPIKINGLTQDQFRLSVFPVSLVGAASKWFKKDCIGLVTTWENLVERRPCLKHLTTLTISIKVDMELFTFEIPGIKAYKEYESNSHTTGDPEEPWSENGVPYQLCDHICEAYRFENGKSKWPTCSSNINGFCNGGELPGKVRFGCMTYFQDRKWYDELADGELKE
uniref:Uncharacterized protein n=1 Tax=Tanacetum cinerariifolium TaxID=118510 RepID=A0A699GLD4_TANCI|nr:hypothetical protein [Tanacetum cinerariifolium]